MHPESLEYADQGLVLNHDEDSRPGGWVPFPAGKHTLDLVDAGVGDPADLARRDLRGKLALLQWGDDRFGEGAPSSVVWTDRVANARKAGAVGVVLFPNPSVTMHSSFTVPALFKQHWPDAGPQELGIPTVEVKQSVGLRLLKLARAGRVTIDVQSDPNVRTMHHLAPTMGQRIGNDLSFAYDARTMATVRSDTHAEGPLRHGFYAVTTWKPGTTFNSTVATELATPKSGLVEYFAPMAPDVLFKGLYFDSQTSFFTVPHVFDRSVSISERRNATPYVPGAVTVPLDGAKYLPPPGAPASIHLFCTMCRQGDRFIPAMQTIGGGGDFSPSLDLASRLYAADGTEIPRMTTGLPAFELSPKSGRYRLVQEASGVNTTWTFTSSTSPTNAVDSNVGCMSIGLGWPGGYRPEPFVYLHYDLGRQLGLDNTVPGGRAHVFDVTAYHNPQSTQRMPDIAGLRLWTSTDGGKHWKPVLVVPGRGSDGKRTFRATAIHPDQPGATVSIKAEAWDRAGNRIEQTVSTAFMLAERR